MLNNETFLSPSTALKFVEFHIGKREQKNINSFSFLFIEFNEAMNNTSWCKQRFLLMKLFNIIKFKRYEPRGLDSCFALRQGAHEFEHRWKSWDFLKIYF